MDDNLQPRPASQHLQEFKMGWLWTTPAQAPTTEKSASSPSPQPSSESPWATPPQTETPKPLSRDEIAEQELKSFLQEIEADTTPNSTKYNRVLKNTSSTDAPAHNDSDEPLSEQLLPTTMSCRDAFDAAFYCNSMGGQFNNLYRYGAVRDCKESWNDFWFCMRTRSFGGALKEEAIRSRFREKERIKYSKEGRENLEEEDVGRSSEDVWKTRDRKVEWGEAFNKSFPPRFDGTDEEWNAIERERRKNIVNGTIGS